jgi:hypothetical protein
MNCFKILIVLSCAAFETARATVQTSLPPAYVQEGDKPELDFKLTALYFADSILKNLKVNGEDIEGANSSDINTAIAEILREQDDARLSGLSESFRIGANYRRAIDELVQLRKYDDPEITRKVKELNLSILNEASEGQEISIPSGWDSHAIIISIAPSQMKSDYFDIRAFNMGAGIEFHENIADPSGTYPYLVKPWKSYIEIPRSVLEKNHFFTLSLMNSLTFKKEPMDFKKFYFYIDFLETFEKFPANCSENENEKKLFIVPQRSGTCSVSSCMARIMFEHESIGDYMRTRVKLGIFLLNRFLNKYRANEIILLMASSGVQFKMILKFALSSLAREVFVMLNLEKSPDQACYPTTNKFKALIEAEESTQCEAKIMPGDRQILVKLVKISLEIISWIESIRLDLSKFSLVPSVHWLEAPKDSTIRISESLSKSFPTFDFDQTQSGNPQHPLPRDHIIETNKSNSSAEVFESLEYAMKSDNQPFICLNLVKILKSVDLSADPSDFDELDSDSWRYLYGDLQILLTNMNNIHNLDCILAFQKLSFYLWKIAVLQDASKKSTSLGLSEYAPPFTFCDIEGLAVRSDLCNFRKHRT